MNKHIDALSPAGTTLALALQSLYTGNFPNQHSRPSPLTAMQANMLINNPAAREYFADALMAAVKEKDNESRQR